MLLAQGIQGSSHNFSRIKTFNVSIEITSPERHANALFGRRIDTRSRQPCFAKVLQHFRCERKRDIVWRGGSVAVPIVFKFSEFFQLPTTLGKAANFSWPYDCSREVESAGRQVALTGEVTVEIVRRQRLMVSTEILRVRICVVN